MADGTINVATLYSKKLEERYSIGSKTNAYAGKKYDFVGNKSLEVLTADRVDLVNYTRSGQNRFGTIYELGDTKQTLFGLFGGLLFWTGWIEFLMGYFAARFGTHYDLVGSGTVQTVTLPVDGIYNLQGQRLSEKPQKGLYIMGGKKYVVK